LWVHIFPRTDVSLDYSSLITAPMCEASLDFISKTKQVL